MQNSNREIAFLTLSHLAYREIILNRWKRFYLPGMASPLRLRPSKKDPDPKHVERLRSTPYIDSSIKRKVEELNNMLKNPIPVNQVSFGVWLDDTLFSCEYTIQSPQSQRSTTGDISLFYDNFRRSIIIREVGKPSDDAKECVPRRNVIISVKNLSCVLTSIKTLSCVLKLRTAVTFEADNPADGKNQIRTAWFDQDHSRIAPFVSSHLLLEFSKLEMYNKAMEHLGKIPHICKIQECAVDVESGSAYARRWMHTLEKWYQELPLQVAIYSEQAIRSGAILPETMLHCRDPINRAVEVSGVPITALTVQNLITLVTQPGSIAKTKWTTGKRPTPTQILELLKEAGKLAVLETRWGGRFKSKDVGLAMQIYVTPTSVLIERELILPVLSYSKKTHTSEC